jgi:hypothetical protein
MMIAIESFGDAREQRPDQMLTQPFREDDRSYPLPPWETRWMILSALMGRIRNKEDIAMTPTRFVWTAGVLAAMWLVAGPATLRAQDSALPGSRRNRY